MVEIKKDIKNLLINCSIYDSLEPLIYFCSLDQKFVSFLKEINESFDTQNSWKSYITLSDLINIHPSGEHEVTFTPTLIQKRFKQYIFSWNRLGFKNIPFNEWSDIAQEGIDLLKILIEENKLEQFESDSRYKNFMKKFGKRHEDLRLSGKYPDLNELMDD